MKLNHWLTMSFGHSPEKGAENYLHAALDSSVKSGEYYGPGCFFGLCGKPKNTATAPKTRNHDLAASLWQQTQSLLDITFDVDEYAIKSTSPRQGIALFD